jgi:hypothetical protein
MNTKNLEYLNTQVFYTGFGTELEKELKQQLETNKPEFTLKHQVKYGNDEANAILHFKKSLQSDLYFFNKYDLLLKQGHQPNQELKQTFYIGKENNITLKEAYNLLSGRAINKNWTRLEKVGEGENIRYEGTGEKYNAWLQLDFKNADESGNFKTQRYHENYNFDLEKALSEQPIKGLNNEQDKTHLLDSLKKGNRHVVVLVEGDQSKQFFIEANPKDRTLNLYDSQMKRINYKQETSASIVEESNNQKEIKSNKTEKLKASDEKENSPTKRKKQRTRI